VVLGPQRRRPAWPGRRLRLLHQGALRHPGAERQADPEHL